MNVFNFIDKEKLFPEIYSDNRIPIKTISKLDRSAVTYNMETDTTSDSSRSRKTTARNYSPKYSRSISN